MIGTIFVCIYIFDLALLVKFIKDAEDTFTFRRSRNKTCFRIADGLIIAGILMLFVDFGWGLLSIATGILLGGIIEMKANNERAYATFLENTNPGRLK